MNKQYAQLEEQLKRRDSNSTKITISLSKEYMQYYKELTKLVIQKGNKDCTISKTIRILLEDMTRHGSQEVYAGIVNYDLKYRPKK